MNEHAAEYIRLLKLKGNKKASKKLQEEIEACWKKLMDFYHRGEKCLE